MCYDSTCLGYLLLAVLFGFAVLIYFLLKHRETFLAENLLLSPDQVWQTASKRAAPLGLSETDLLYGIFQDKTATTTQIVIKDATGEIVGHTEHLLGARGFSLVLGNATYQVNYPLTWRKTAVLTQGNGQVLATFERLPLSVTKHRFEFPELGGLVSQRPAFNFRFSFDYSQNGNIVGITQQISAARQVGGVGIFPANYPLVARAFVLAIYMRGI